MFKLLVIAALAVAVTNVAAQFGAGSDDTGPEDMHFPVVRALNALIERYSDSLMTLIAMKMRFATKLSENDKQLTLLNKAIMWKGDCLSKLVEYAGNRGINPDDYAPQAADLSECDMVYGCYKLNLRMEREIYKVLQDAYSAAGSHEDGDAQAKLVPLVQSQLDAIRFNKRVIAIVNAKQAKATPADTKPDDDSLFDDTTLL